MNYRDSAEEAEFRSRLRAWIAANNPGLPASSTSDDYWAGQAGWHRALYDAGFFGLSWPADIGGPSARGTVVCNPPYDQRLAADASLYRELGDALQRAVPAWRATGARHSATTNRGSDCRRRSRFRAGWWSGGWMR